MDIKQLEYFCTIVQEGSISCAARKLYMSQPPLSYQMKQLESELNCQLFERGAKSIKLTKSGSLLYQKAIDIIESVNNAKREIMLANQFHTIRLGVISSMINLVVDKIQEYQAANKDAIVELKEANTYQLIELLRQNQLDVAIVRKPYPNNELKEIKLIDDKMVAAAKKLPDNVDLSYLSTVDLVIYRRWQDVITQEFEKNKLTCHFVCLNDDARTSLQLAKKTSWVAMIPHSSLDQDDKELVYKPINDFKLNSSVYLVYQNDSAIVEKLSHFLR